jgi:hypothetical protein
MSVPGPLRHVLPDRTGGTGGRRSGLGRRRRDARELAPSADEETTSTLILIGDQFDPTRLVSRANTPGCRLLAAVLSSSLDRELASGRHPEAGRLLAVRAVQLVSPSTRAALAHHWQGLLVHAHRPPVARDPRHPLCRDRIVAAEGAVRAMLAALSASGPVPARGVAMARLLLSDGAGPLYNRHCAADLHEILREVTAQLGPTPSLIGPSRYG